LISQLERIPTRYFEHITGSNRLYEIRVEVGSNIYRVFCFFDKEKLVIVINGFQKKSQKTPRQEIVLAQKMKKSNKNLTTFSDHLDRQYGKRGTKKRENYEQEFEAFKLGVMIQELRKEKGLTQEELAEKCGTSKTYISRIENNASDIRLSTLMRIIQDGLGGRLTLSVYQ
jgi:DNA-binding XRE family transcriptional regulator/putative component of toxin-antitoxin plasmid stabilization module